MATNPNSRLDEVKKKALESLAELAGDGEAWFSAIVNHMGGDYMPLEVMEALQAMRAEKRAEYGPGGGWKIVPLA